MRIGRTILALLIALSVAMLPAAAGARLVAKSAGASAMSSMDMSSMEQMADMDCCPHKVNPCDHGDDCGTMATCALKCFNFADTSLATMAFPSVFAQIRLVAATDPFTPQPTSPPFRPPRI